ncbi:MAG: SH3 domain-containing protein, partial [Lachnospiraceae bacterium]|nr:SH3 domain-containing protein [Lachnospiraceae bacterium]
MRRRVPQAVSLCLIASLAFTGAQGFPVIAAESETVAEADGETESGTSLKEETEEAKAEVVAEEADSDAEAAADADSETDASEEEEDSVVGELIFAQCEDYVNVRTLPNTDSPVTAKLYNNDSATVVGISDDEEWYIVSSGNAYGYVKAEYFATGEEAEAIAEKVAYNVARVYADELNVRQEASTDSEVIDVAYENDEIEVVLYGEDWMKVALGNDVYGYVSSDYVEYVTYYPVGETLEEEEARLIAEGILAADDAVMQTEAAETEAYVETEAATETEAYVEAETYVETEAYVQTEAYVETEAAAQTETTAETEAAQTETTAETETAQTETTAETEAAQTETTAETEAASTESSS